MSERFGQNGRRNVLASSAKCGVPQKAGLVDHATYNIFQRRKYVLDRIVLRTVRRNIHWLQAAQIHHFSNSRCFVKVDVVHKQSTRSVNWQIGNERCKPFCVTRTFVELVMQHTVSRNRHDQRDTSFALAKRSEWCMQWHTARSISVFRVFSKTNRGFVDSSKFRDVYVFHCSPKGFCELTYFVIANFVVPISLLAGYPKVSQPSTNGH